MAHVIPNRRAYENKQQKCNQSLQIDNPQSQMYHLLTSGNSKVKQLKLSNLSNQQFQCDVQYFQIKNMIKLDSNDSTQNSQEQEDGRWLALAIQNRQCQQIIQSLYQQLTQQNHITETLINKMSNNVGKISLYQKLTHSYRERTNHILGEMQHMKNDKSIKGIKHEQPKIPSITVSLNQINKQEYLKNIKYSNDNRPTHNKIQAKLSQNNQSTLFQQLKTLKLQDLFDYNRNKVNQHNYQTNKTYNFQKCHPNNQTDQLKAIKIATKAPVISASIERPYRNDKKQQQFIKCPKSSFALKNEATNEKQRIKIIDQRISQNANQLMKSSSKQGEKRTHEPLIKLHIFSILLACQQQHHYVHSLCHYDSCEVMTVIFTNNNVVLSSKINQKSNIQRYHPGKMRTHHIFSKNKDNSNKRQNRNVISVRVDVKPFK